MNNPDSYINDYYIKNFQELQKPPTKRFNNLNISKLPFDKKKLMVSVDIRINESLIISNNIEWDITENRSIYKFTGLLINGFSSTIMTDEFKDYNLANIPNQIRDQIIEHIDENTYFSRVRLVKNEYEAPSLDLLCGNCGTVKFNNDYCVNCMFVYEKKNFTNTLSSTIGKDMFLGESTNNELNNKFETKPTERQKLLELKQKDKDPIESFTLTYNEAKEKKICGKCGELNGMIALQCKKCSSKFPVCDYFDLKLQENFAINFWDKINKHNTLQQLKNFQTKFYPEDFSSLKYLYFKIIYILKVHFEQILTEDAYSEILKYLEKIYKLYTMNSNSVYKIFENSYYTKFGKPKSKIPMLNFNQLKDIIEGSLPENETEDIDDDEIMMKLEVKKEEEAKLLNRKRGRPKKLEIFKAGANEEEGGVKLTDRIKLFNNVLCPPPFKHFDFCGKCFKEGKLVCCESCSSSYHYDCLHYDKPPKGKFKCYYCKIVKFGIANSTFVDIDQLKIVKKIK